MSKLKTLLILTALFSTPGLRAADDALLVAHCAGERWRSTLAVRPDGSATLDVNDDGTVRSCALRMSYAVSKPNGHVSVLRVEWAVGECTPPFPHKTRAELRSDVQLLLEPLAGAKVPEVRLQWLANGPTTTCRVKAIQKAKLVEASGRWDR